MGLISNIQWTDATWNVAIGCSKVSEGCKYCYMMRDFGPGSFKGKKNKQTGEPIEVNGTVTRTSKATFEKPLLWQEKGIKSIDGTPLKVFTSSLTDVFHEQIDSYRHEIWDIIRRCPDLIFQILTKRPERIAGCLPDDWGDGYPNVWIGCTIENKNVLKPRIIHMDNFKAKIKFISFEPLLGYISLSDVFEPKYQYSETGRFIYDYSPSLFDWAIIGGESGNDTGKWRYRAASIDWFEDLTMQLKDYEIPYFFKQTGTYLATEMRRQGFNVGRHGGNVNELPSIYDLIKERKFPHYLQTEIDKTIDESLEKL